MQRIGTAGESVIGEILDGTTVIQRIQMQDANANEERTQTAIAVDTAPSSGSHTYKFRAKTTSGSGTVLGGTEYPATILVEDIGPQ